MSSTSVRELTIVVPAFKERRLRPTVRELVEEARNSQLDFEIIIVDDGSTDNTASVAEHLKSELPDVLRVIRQPVNQGVGRAFECGLKLASCRFITLVPGDNAFARTGIARIFGAVGSADLIVSYRSNPSARTFLRRWLSRFV
jgi:glycosyltransferase involved in cell wall biosynthesis